MLVNIGKGSRAPLDVVDRMLDCHVKIRHFIDLAKKLGEDRIPAKEATEVAASIVRYFTQALPHHVADEEQSVYPRLLGKAPRVDGALKAMVDQHSAHRAELEELIGICSAIATDPSTYVPALSALLRVANSLGNEFEEHLELEEAVIFPAMRELLSADELSQIETELRNRRS